MSTTQQIRITKTKEMEKVFMLLREKFSLLSESEIVKILLSKAYNDITHGNFYYLSSDEENGVLKSMDEIEKGKSFRGSAKEIEKWLEA